MYLACKVDEFIERLNLNSELENCKIIKAYPYAMKQTQLQNSVVAVSLGNLEAKNVEIGGEVLCGSYIINAFIYSPYGQNEFGDLIKSVVSSQLEAYPSSVSVSEVNKNDSLGCLYVKCGFTFYENFDFGGVENE